MLTRLRIRNFKRFRDVDIELGDPVVFIGPNNSGKTAALQALALWNIGVRRWNEKRSGKTAPERRPGVTINRRDLIAIPVPEANLLWKNLHVRDVSRNNGGQVTRNVRIDITVDGVSEDKVWSCGLEFDYGNEESIYCRPMRLSEGNKPSRMGVPDEVNGIRIAFLPPMSGLTANETRLDQGAVNVRLGEGRTAEVLRNLCYQIATEERRQGRWEDVKSHIKTSFGVQLEDPIYVTARGEITMAYRDSSGVKLDLSSAGRGLQQTLLLLAHLAANPGSVLLLDEPDAHLEILRQREIYQSLVDFAAKEGNQVIIASHSEVILDEAARRDTVVAFVGKPHRIDDRDLQLRKSLKDIGYEQYYQAEQTGWVLYVEGSTDVAVLKALARKLNHPAAVVLERPFVHYVANQPTQASNHFFGLREAKPDLVGVALFDRIDRDLPENPELLCHKWRKREIENYLCATETLLAWASESVEGGTPGPLFEPSEREKRRSVMRECIEDFAPRAAQRDPSDPWWADVKASDEFLDRLFGAFFKKLDLPNLMRKTDYHVLARHVPVSRIDPEVSEVLDLILTVARSAKPASDEGEL